jgi:hypothetical protein
MSESLDELVESAAASYVAAPRRFDLPQFFTGACERTRMPPETVRTRFWAAVARRRAAQR